MLSDEEFVASLMNTLPLPFDGPPDLRSFCGRFSHISYHTHRFWIMCLVGCPWAQNHQDSVRDIIHRMVFAERLSMGPELDELRRRKLDRILDHAKAHPRCWASLTDMRRCWLESAE